MHPHFFSVEKKKKNDTDYFYLEFLEYIPLWKQAVGLKHPFPRISTPKSSNACGQHVQSFIDNEYEVDGWSLFKSKVCVEQQGSICLALWGKV